MHDIFALSFHALKWLGVLAGALAFTVGGVLLPAVLRHRTQPRSHHKAKLLNECLAKTHLAFATYFLSFLVSADFDERLADFVKPITIAVLAVSAIFYFFGILSFLDQDWRINKLHCSEFSRSGQGSNTNRMTVLEKCKNPLPFKDLLKLCGKNVFFSFVLLVIGFAEAFLRGPSIH